MGPNARLHNAPSTRMSAGPLPDRSYAMTVPSFEIACFMVRPCSMRGQLALRGGCAGKERAQPCIAQVEAAPDEHRDVDREEGVAEERILHPHMRGDGAAE